MTVFNDENKLRVDCSEATIIPFDFKIFKDTDLKVSLINNETLEETDLRLNTDYTVKISRIRDGGDIILNQTHAGCDLFIYRQISITQPQDVPTEGAFPEKSIENALDRSCMIDQQLQEQVNRCIQIPGFLNGENFENVDVNLPVPVAENVIAWDDEGKALTNYDIKKEVSEFEENVNTALLEARGEFQGQIDGFNSTINEFTNQVSSTIETVTEAAGKINQMEIAVNTCIESAETAQEAAQRAQFYTNMQADWSQDDPTQKDYIKNKPQTAYGLPLKSCKKCKFNYDSENLRYSLTWFDPDDILADNVNLAQWIKTVVVFKEGGYPTSINDGTILIEETVKNSYNTTPYTFDAEEEKDYYFKAFPVTKGGHITNDEVGQFIDYEKYTFSKHLNESNPDTRITYSGDNENYSPAFMNFAIGIFNYGDWQDAFFLSDEWLSPCMVYNQASGRNGEIAYFLNKNDYSKKIDGTNSDITSTSSNMNAMMRIKIIWFKRTLDRENNVVTVNIASKQADDSYKPYGGFIKPDGSVREYIYLPIFRGYIQSNNVLRSISGNIASGDRTILEFRTLAQANGAGWDLETWSDRQMLQDLFMLMCKSTDCQSKIGRGNCDQSSATYIAEGTLNRMSLCYGQTNGKSAVKFLGMENLWGGKTSFILGLLAKNGKGYYKACQGTSDGTTVSDYSLTSVDGYNVVHENNVLPESSLASALLSCNQGYPIEGVGEFINTKKIGSNTTYDCDEQGIVGGSSVLYVTITGGNSKNGSGAGLFAHRVVCAYNFNAQELGAAVSYKPV